MKGEPKCPYCGSTMIPEYMPPDDHFFRCLYCKGVQSPSRSTAYEAWKEAAKPTIKNWLLPLLTQKELRGLIAAGEEAVIYCETKYDSQTYATIIYDGKMFDRYGKPPGVKHMNFETYGKTWRAWETRPTEEERAAAPWEE